jgi:hypothetical protein
LGIELVKVIEVRDVQTEKQLSLIETIELGKVIGMRKLHLKKP